MPDRLGLVRAIGREHPDVQQRMLQIVQRYRQWPGPGLSAEEWDAAGGRQIFS